MSPGETNPAAWSERYESLRRYATENRQTLGSDPIGLIVLIRCGVAGWMRHWTSITSDSSAPVALPEPPPSLPTPDWQHQLTLVLAQITAQHLHPSPSL